jgi:farnesyl-diphosphate farnesyltransferase
MQVFMPNLLRRVSRSFYLTIRVLPAAIRPQIGLAYLLARTTDTIADTQLISVGHRRAALRQMKATIQAVAEGRPAELPDFGPLADAQGALAGQGSSAEKVLLENAAALFDALGALKPDDTSRIRDLLEIIIQGQDSDLVRFGSARADQIAALDTENDLEEYTYRVAGCVGEFWTRMCRAHLFAKADIDDTFLLTSGIRFGKGLQMVNILRDLPADLRLGRCYIPLTRLKECGLEPKALLHAEEMGRFRPLYAGYLEQARDELAAGWSYTNSLPQNEMRIRLACAWPVLIGVRTLALLRCGNVLDDRRRIKVSRGEVRRIVVRSLICYPDRRDWNRLFDWAAAGPRRWPL